MGAASEATAAAWYLGRGVPVYLPICKAGPVDFLIEREDGIKRVQVKTACWRDHYRDKYRYITCPTRSSLNNKDVHVSKLYDILFIVCGERRWEIPADVINSSDISLDGEYKGSRKSKWHAYEIR